MDVDGDARDILSNFMPNSKGPSHKSGSSSVNRTKAVPATPYSKPMPASSHPQQPSSSAPSLSTSESSTSHSKSKSNSKSKSKSESKTESKKESKTESKTESKATTKTKTKTTGNAAAQGVTSKQPEASKTRQDSASDKPPKPKPKPRPRTKSSKPQEEDEEVNKVVEAGVITSDDESAERDAAMSSPVKGGVARLTSKVRYVFHDFVTRSNGNLSVLEHGSYRRHGCQHAQPGSHQD